MRVCLSVCLSAGQSRWRKQASGRAHEDQLRRNSKERGKKKENGVGLEFFSSGFCLGKHLWSKLSETVRRHTHSGGSGEGKGERSERRWKHAERSFLRKTPAKPFRLLQPAAARRVRTQSKLHTFVVLIPSFLPSHHIPLRTRHPPLIYTNMAPIGQIYGYVGHPKVNRVSTTANAFGTRYPCRY